MSSIPLSGYAISYIYAITNTLTFLIILIKFETQLSSPISMSNQCSWGYCLWGKGLLVTSSNPHGPSAYAQIISSNQVTVTLSGFPKQTLMHLQR